MTQVFSLHTDVHDNLTEMYRKWYPESNEYVKLVPKDFELTPISLLHWFMDDGCAIIHHHNRKNKKYNNENLYISLATNGFYKKDEIGRAHV